MFLNQEIRNRNESFSNVFAKKTTTFFNFWYLKNGVKKRNRVKKNQKRVKQNEKPIFQDTEKDKKTWNINQCKKMLNKRKQRKWSFFCGKEKTEKKSFAAVSKDTLFFFGTVFYIKKHQDNKRPKKEVWNKTEKKLKETRKQEETKKKREQMEWGWMKGGHEEVKKTFLQKKHVAKEIKKIKQKSDMVQKRRFKNK